MTDDEIEALRRVVEDAEAAAVTEGSPTKVWMPTTTAQALLNAHAMMIGARVAVEQAEKRVAEAGVEILKLRIACAAPEACSDHAANCCVDWCVGCKDGERGLKMRAAFFPHALDTKECT